MNRPLTLLLGGCVLLAGAAAAGVVPGWVGACAGGAAVGALMGARVRDPRHDFVRAVSHELRTPIAQIRLLSETLLLGNADEADRSRWLEGIAREAQILDDRVSGILLYAHGDGLGTGAPPQRLDLGTLVEDVTAGYADAAVCREMRVTAEAEPGLMVTGDPRTLRLALVNLLENACRFGPVGQTVRVTAVREGRQARITVIDDGPGIPAGDRERVWEPFFRRDDGNGLAGQGLGLSVVRRIAAGHGGSAAVDPAPGRGAAVSIRLPLAAWPEQLGAGR